MDSEDDQFLNQVLSGISEADIVTIFFPLLRRALVVDTRHDETTPQMISVLPQVHSMEERIAVIERLRPQFGKVRSIVGVPWLKSVNTLRDGGVTDQIIRRLIDTGMSAFSAGNEMEAALRELGWVEHRSFLSMIRGEGYRTVWSAPK